MHFRFSWKDFVLPVGLLILSILFVVFGIFYNKYLVIWGIAIFITNIFNLILTVIFYLKDNGSKQ